MEATFIFVYLYTFILHTNFVTRLRIYLFSIIESEINFILGYNGNKLLYNSLLAYNKCVFLKSAKL